MPVAFSPKCQRRFTKLSLQFGGYSRNLVCRGQGCCSAPHNSYMSQMSIVLRLKNTTLGVSLLSARKMKTKVCQQTFLPPLALPILAALSTLSWSLATPGKNTELFFPLDSQTTDRVCSCCMKEETSMKSEVARKCNDKAIGLLFFHPKEAWFYWPLPFYWLLPTTPALNENSSSTTHYYLYRPAH